MMYVRDEQEVREYILDGNSKRRAASARASAERRRAAIQMPDFLDLVQSDEELRQWVLEGRIDRLLSNRIARPFLATQRLQMPAYRAALAPEDAAAVVAYIRWLRKER